MNGLDEEINILENVPDRFGPKGRETFYGWKMQLGAEETCGPALVGNRAYLLLL